MAEHNKNSPKGPFIINNQHFRRYSQSIESSLKSSLIKRVHPPITGRCT